MGVAALVVSVIDGSLALAGLALTALLDSSASVVLVWRFRTERRDPVAAEHLERRAQALVAVTMLVIAAYIGVQSVRALIDGSHRRHRSSAWCSLQHRLWCCRGWAGASSVSRRVWPVGRCEATGT